MRGGNERKAEGKGRGRIKLGGRDAGVQNKGSVKKEGR